MTTPTEKYRDEVLKALEERKYFEQGMSPTNARYQFNANIDQMISMIRALPIPAETSEPEQKSCTKVEHHGTGYLHAADDDRPYDVDGVKYCGRCHGFITHGTQHYSEPPAQAVEERDDHQRIMDIHAWQDRVDCRIFALEATVNSLALIFRANERLFVALGEDERDAKNRILSLARKIERGDVNG